MLQWVYQCDLKLDLLTALWSCGRQYLYLSESACEMLNGFDERRALQCPMARFIAPFDGHFSEPRLSEVMRQQFRLGRGGVGKPIPQNLSRATMQSLATALK